MLLRPEELEVSQQLAEFDQWLTARLDRIKDSPKFNTEIRSLCQCIETISEYLDEFSKYQSYTIENICEAVISAGNEFITGETFIEDENHVSIFYESFFNLLFLTTGATDNNLKNHFLISLNERGIRPLMPKRSSSKKNLKFTLKDVPLTIKSEAVAKHLASYTVGISQHYISNVKTEPTFDLEVYLKVLLKEYISLIIKDEDDIKQFWAICHSYLELNNFDGTGEMGVYLLNACTIFKVRGSVTATGGHITEDLLREKLIEIGLRPDSDFNTRDVKIGEEEIVENGKRKRKTRAYDFIIPYDIDNWSPKPKLFIQAQFYAGDSGSVSHKVVDQTRSSRDFTLSKYKTARFVEYLDGAGYYASLRGDLEHMLAFADTASFFQVKSILVRLRREFQCIKFLTPIEFEHAVLTSEDGLETSIFESLKSDDYPEEEIERITSVCIEFGYVTRHGNTLSISPERRDIARRLLVLDLAANNAEAVTDEQRRSMKFLLVPGYGQNHAVQESVLACLSENFCKQVEFNASLFTKDIEWLLDEGVISRG